MDSILSQIAFCVKYGLNKSPITQSLIESVTGDPTLNGLKQQHPLSLIRTQVGWILFHGRPIIPELERLRQEDCRESSTIILRV